MDVRGLTAEALASALRVPAGRVSAIVAGKRAVTADTALRPGRYFGTGPELWLNVQFAYDLARAEAEIGERIANEVQPAT